MDHCGIKISLKKRYMMSLPGCLYRSKGKRMTFPEDYSTMDGREKRAGDKKLGI